MHERKNFAKYHSQKWEHFAHSQNLAHSCIRTITKFIEIIIKFQTNILVCLISIFDLFVFKRNEILIALMSLGQLGNLIPIGDAISFGSSIFLPFFC